MTPIFPAEKSALANGAGSPTAITTFRPRQQTGLGIKPGACLFDQPEVVETGTKADAGLGLLRRSCAARRSE